MKKARLIKKESEPAVVTERKRRSGSPAVEGKRSRRQMVAEWLERRRERPDPRQAFAALFMPPKVS